MLALVEPHALRFRHGLRSFHAKVTVDRRGLRCGRDPLTASAVGSAHELLFRLELAHGWLAWEWLVSKALVAG